MHQKVNFPILFCRHTTTKFSSLVLSIAFIQLHIFGVRDYNRFVCSLYIFYHINCSAKSIKKKRDESITKRLSRLKLFYHPPSNVCLKLWLYFKTNNQEQEQRNLSEKYFTFRRYIISVHDLPVCLI